VEETRVAPPDSEELELLTDQEQLPGAVARSRADETRMAPLDEGANETRMGPEPVPQRGGRGPSPREVSTEVRGTGGVPKAGKAAAGWLAKGEKRAAPAKNVVPVGVVRLSPLEPAGGKEAPEEGSPLRTMFANHSALLAEELRAALSKKVYGRGPHRVLRIDEPEGPSTAGGKLARQSIALVPRKGSGPSLVCGWVDVSKREAQLRNFDAVAKRYESHHGEPLELRADEYERFLNDVEEVLTRAVIKVRVMVPEEAPGARVVAPAVARRKGVPGFWVLVLAALAFGLGVMVGRLPPG
jgi:translation initiation factor IF-2